MEFEAKFRQLEVREERMEAKLKRLQHKIENTGFAQNGIAGTIFYGNGRFGYGVCPWWGHVFCPLWGNSFDTEFVFFMTDAMQVGVWEGGIRRFVVIYRQNIPAKVLASKIAWEWLRRQIAVETCYNIHLSRNLASEVMYWIKSTQTCTL